MSTRLYRSIIAFGATLGVGTGIAAVVSVAGSGCDTAPHRAPIDAWSGNHDGWPVIGIDASPDAAHKDASWAIIDASSDAAWNTIADAPTAPAIPRGAT